jgi:hypothetical protein|tara:strand:+ start:2016 stop:2243 length:228 start_codon:yes stop_codon:yes gene_type:complete
MILKADGFDDAILGLGRRCGQTDLLVYDVDKCIAILRKDGMTDEEAIEYFEFNVVGSWMGEGTPIFLYRGVEDEE